MKLRRMGHVIQGFLKICTKREISPQTTVLSFINTDKWTYLYKLYAEISLHRIINDWFENDKQNIYLRGAFSTF